MSDDLIPPDDTEPLPPIEAYEAVISTEWRGPLPPPNLLRQYNEAFPGCAERIVAIAETESKARHEAERHERESRRIIIQGDVFSQKLGLMLAFVLAVFVISIGAFLIYTGHLVWGTSIVGFPMVALISLFIYGRQRQSADLRKFSEVDEEG